MKFTLKTIKPFVKGCHKVYEENGSIGFDRFTEEQRAQYQEGTVPFARTCTLPGVRLDFETDATGLAFSSVHNKITKAVGSIRFWFDVTVNGPLYDSKGVSRGIDRDHPEKNDVEDMAFSFRLPAGDKRVSLYFPSLFKVFLKDLELSGETYVRPVKNARTLVFFGDSITEDCSVYHTSFSYPNIVARELDAEIFNYAIGGERFRAEKMNGIRYHKADAVISLYGTNDLFGKDMYRFVTNVEGYLEGLHKTYPRTPVYVVLPIPRLNGAFDDKRVIPSMEFIREEISLAVEKKGYSNFRVVNGRNLVPALPEFYFDRSTHPNDLGHTHLGFNLAREILKDLKK